MAKKNAGVSKPSEPTKSEAKRTDPTPSTPGKSAGTTKGAAAATTPKANAKKTTAPAAAAATTTAIVSTGAVETKPGAALSHEDVARAAYLRWERYGGDSESNWLAAERELQGKA